MILLHKDKMNLVVVTLTEKKRVNTNIYLFEFINSTSKEKFYVISEDTSFSKNRFNRFCIEEKPSADINTSEISLELLGEYTYSIYENPLSLISPAGLNKVESGKMILKDSSEQVEAFSESDINIVFND